MRDVLYAMTEDGKSLPIIDVTNPVFTLSSSDAELARMSEQFAREHEQRQQISPELREALARSILGKALMKAAGTYLPGMITYRMKLGPDQQGEDAQPIDRSIAASFPAFTARLRLQDMARLLADGVAQSMAASPNRPICLINIGGGPAADSWNALILLRAEHPSFLTDSPIGLAILDIDLDGPRFGERALARLCAPGAPLGGLAISFRSIQYDWSQTIPLAGALADMHAAEAVCAISSEGGLFEYGSDEDILVNLRTLQSGTASCATIVGSVTREENPAGGTRSPGLVAARPRSMQAFRSLALKAGWAVEHVIERPFSYHVRLVKA